MQLYPKNNNKKSQRNIRRWHRWVGFSSMFFVLILSITGLILNRTEQFNLNHITIKNPLIASLYNQPTAKPPLHFSTNNIWISWLGDRVYLNGEYIVQSDAPLIGVASQENIILLASSQHLTLITTDGNHIETMTGASLPGEIENIGLGPDDTIVLKSNNRFYSSIDDFLSWSPVTIMGEYNASLSVEAPENISNTVLEDFQGKGQTLYRIMLDLHSGRILGTFGPYLMDLAAISLIFLSITGFMKRKRNDKDKRRRK